MELESKLHQEDIGNLTAKVEDLKLQLDDTNTEVIEHSNEIEEIQGSCTVLKRLKWFETSLNIKPKNR